MRSLSDTGDHVGEGGEPEYGIDDVDERVEVGIGKTAYPSENRESGLVDESRYAAPTLQKKLACRLGGMHSLKLLTRAK